MGVAEGMDGVGEGMDGGQGWMAGGRVDWWVNLGDIDIREGKFEIEMIPYREPFCITLYTSVFEGDLVMCIHG